MKTVDGYTYFIDGDGGLAVGFHQGRWRLFSVRKTPDRKDLFYTFVGIFMDEKTKDRFIEEMERIMDVEDEQDVLAEEDTLPTMH